MQLCTALQTDNHASTPPLSFYRLPYQQHQSTEGQGTTDILVLEFVLVVVVVVVLVVVFI